jgi:hypothetical protein
VAAAVPAAVPGMATDEATDGTAPGRTIHTGGDVGGVLTARARILLLLLLLFVLSMLLLLVGGTAAGDVGVEKAVEVKERNKWTQGLVPLLL